LRLFQGAGNIRIIKIIIVSLTLLIVKIGIVKIGRKYELQQ